MSLNILDRRAIIFPHQAQIIVTFTLCNQELRSLTLTGTVDESSIIVTYNNDGSNIHLQYRYHTSEQVTIMKNSKEYIGTLVSRTEDHLTISGDNGIVEISKPDTIRSNRTSFLSFDMNLPQNTPIQLRYSTPDLYWLSYGRYCLNSDILNIIMEVRIVNNTTETFKSMSGITLRYPDPYSTSKNLAHDISVYKLSLTECGSGVFEYKLLLLEVQPGMTVVPVITYNRIPIRKIYYAYISKPFTDIHTGVVRNGYIFRTPETLVPHTGSIYSYNGDLLISEIIVDLKTKDTMVELPLYTTDAIKLQVTTHNLTGNTYRVDMHLTNCLLEPTTIKIIIDLSKDRIVNIQSTHKYTRDRDHLIYTIDLKSEEQLDISYIYSN